MSWLDNTPDRPEPDLDFIQECVDCGADVEPESKSAIRCEVCLAKRVREDRQRQLRETLVDIARTK